MIAADGRDVWHSSENLVDVSVQHLSSSARPAKVRKFVSITLYLISTKTLVFISEITARAFIIADSNKRRTLSRSDISKALSKSDQFDFLIDIVPREDAPFGGPGSTQHTLNLGVGGPSNSHERQGEGGGKDQVREFWRWFIDHSPPTRPSTCSLDPLTWTTRTKKQNLKMAVTCDLPKSLTRYVLWH